MEGNNTEHFKMKLLVTIMDYGYEKELTDMYIHNNMPFHIATHGFGTASSEILEYLGLGETKKNITLSLIQENQVNSAFHILQDKLHFNYPGKGVAFTIPIACMSNIINHLQKGVANSDSFNNIDCEVQHMKQERIYELIITIVTQGYSEETMDAAKAAGATGGTIIHARGLGSSEAAKFLGITIQSEKDLILILAKREQKHAIMDNIIKAVGIATPGKGIVFSLPVDETIGLDLVK